jgi:hypothetical protein
LILDVIFSYRHRSGITHRRDSITHADRKDSITHAVRGTASSSLSHLFAPDAHPEVTNSLLAFIGVPISSINVPISNPSFKRCVAASQLKPEATISSIRSSPRLSPAHNSLATHDEDVGQ